MPFTERTPLEKGFTAVYEAEIQPQLSELEFERQASVKRSNRNTALIAGATVLLIALAYFVIPEIFTATLIIAPLCAIVAAMYIRDGATIHWIVTIRDLVLPQVCAHAGGLQYQGKGDRFSLSPFQSLRLLPSHDKANRSNLIRGTHAGLDFEMIQASLTEKRTDGSDEGSNQVQVYKGLLFRIDLPQTTPDPGHVAVLRDRGGVGNKLAETFSFGSARSMPKLAFSEDTAFEAKFEAYAEDPEAARSVLTDKLRAALVQLEGGEPFVAGVETRRLYLAIDRSTSFLAVGYDDQATTDIEDEVHDAFANIEEVQGILATISDGLS